MSSVVVVALFRVQPGKRELAEGVMRSVIDPTHLEAGCQYYALHRDTRDPDLLVLVEKWTSQVALEAHLQQPYVGALGKRAGELLAAAPELHFLEPVTMGDPLKGLL